MNEKICRLCLQTISNDNCQAVEESLLKSLKLNLNITKGNVMCIECANCLQIFSNFTSGCVCMRDGTWPLSDLKDGAKSDPVQIEATSNRKSLMKAEIKCSFCTETHGREDLVSLRESNENKFLVTMLGQYILEMNLKNIEELLTCEACLEALQGGLSVILKCLEVEEKISKYIELEGTDDKGQIELKKLQQFTFRPILKLEIESFGVNPKLEARCDQNQEEYPRMIEGEIKDEKEIDNTELIIETEDAHIKSERSDCDATDIKSEQGDCDGFQEAFVGNENPNDPLRISVVISEMRKSKNHVKQRLLTRTKTFHCEICSYVTKHKGHLNDHLLIHKSPSEITMFKCELCSYEAKQKSHLKDHLLTHKSPTEVKTFKCEFCSYEAKRKGHLRQHLLTHKSPLEIKMFKCEFCSYEAKHKNHLKVHLLTHKSPSEIQMFKCEMCLYEAKRKVHLKRHLLTHKSFSELKMFKCESCSYETKYKSALDVHLLTHKNPSEIKTFKCEVCSYEAKRKSALKLHLLIHKSPSEIKMFKCELCSYEAKQKCHLKEHLLTHKSPSEIKMFKCEMCSYEAKRKDHLRQHLLTHRSSLEIKMFKCESCSYEAKRKSDLKRHLLTHKSLLEIKMFKREPFHT